MISISQSSAYLYPRALTFSRCTASFGGARSFSCTSRALKNDGDNASQRLQGSAKLFADAALEESAPPMLPSPRVTLLENQHKNWDGDESMEDAVLRMLVDKYKPLRTGTIQTAEEKIRQGGSTIAAKASWETVASTPLLAAKEGHQPWHTTFKVPSHAQESIRVGRLPPPISARGRPPVDERAWRKELEAKRRGEAAGRLGRAKEGVLDYRLGAGVKGQQAEAGGAAGNGNGQPRQANPVTMRGWASLVEDRIEKARKAGLFNTVSGRGKPLVAQIEETNPFIKREEFLMNRILQRNGASPPWVDVQGELEQAVISFREITRQSWIRQALRTLTISRPLYTFSDFTLAQARALRDPEWETRERRYHELALESLNSLVRKYNGLAPYAVRRPLHLREVELEKAYTDAAEDIVRGIEERVSKASRHGFNGGAMASLDGSEPGQRSGGPGGSEPDVSASAASPSLAWRIRDVVRGWLSRWTLRSSRR